MPVRSSAVSKDARSQWHPPGAKYNENRAFSSQKATAARYNRSLFQRLAREIRYLADQWKINGIFSPINEFCAR
jgi:hypothetical protein